MTAVSLELSPVERTQLDQEVARARDELLTLGVMVRRATQQAVQALKDHDMDRARLVYTNDGLLNQKRFQIESDVITVIATQQPAAQDLRTLTAVLDLATELERMGDYAKGIALINLRSGGLSLPKLLNDIQYMSQKSLDMLQRALTAFVELDVGAAEQIAREDDLIDALYEQLYFEMMDHVVEDASNIERANYVLWVGHNLERLADRVTNICERTLFVATGDLKFTTRYSN